MQPHLVLCFSKPFQYCKESPRFETFIQIFKTFLNSQNENPLGIVKTCFLAFSHIYGKVLELKNV
jgi:hypothetical protein